MAPRPTDKLETALCEEIDEKLEAAHWAIQGKKRINFHESLRVAVCEFDIDRCSVMSAHSLIIHKCHIGTFLKATEEECQALLQLIDQAKAGLDSAYQPAANNIGITDCPAGGIGI